MERNEVPRLHLHIPKLGRRGHPSTLRRNRHTQFSRSRLLAGAFSLKLRRSVYLERWTRALVWHSVSNPTRATVYCGCAFQTSPVLSPAVSFCLSRVTEGIIA
ncbi:unnamed protein product, partial [Ectocarpus sp. 12 AP-2014]